MAGTGHGAVKIAGHLVHTGHYDHLLGAEAQGGHTVAHAIDVHQLTVLGDGVAAHEEGVAGQSLTQHVHAFVGGLGGVPVDERLIALAQTILDAQLIHGGHTAPADHVALGDQLQHLFHSFLGGGAIVGVKLPLLHGLDQSGAGLVVLRFHRC